MKKDREELEKTIYYVIDDTEKNAKEYRQKFETTLLQYNISRGKAIGIYGKSIPLIQLSLPELYIVTKVLHQITAYTVLCIDNWYYDEEIRTYESYKAEKTYAKDIIVLHNVDKVSDNQYFCTKAYHKETAKITGQGLITYNFRTQRGAKLILFGDRYSEIPDIKKSVVAEIKEKILNNKFTPNTITLNRRKTGLEKPPEHDEKNRTLYMEVDGIENFVDIVDGAHRCQSFIKVIEDDPENEGFTFISILYYTEEEAQEYIEQEDHRTPINKEHIQSFKTDEYTLLTKDIAKYGNAKINEMFNKIATNRNELKSRNKYITVKLFAEALSYNIELDARNMDDYKRYFVAFFNELIGLTKEKGLDKSNSVAFEENMFIGYITLASIWSDEDYKANLKKFIDNTDFSRDNRQWEENGIFVAQMTMKKAKSIVNYFKKVGVDNV
ncbi:MAG TPA: hypothetical protein DEG71_05025 [Clostridiales bacterium]|nr:hypothetical protein [Clostridiales bacterium]